MAFFCSRIISTYIYSDLDDFFCTSSGGEDFSKSYWIKIFLFEFWFENNIGTNRKEGFIRFHDLYLRLSLMKQLMTISAITHLSRVKKNHRDFLVNIYPSFDIFLNHEKKIWVRLRHLWYTCIYSRQILRTNEKKRDGRGGGERRLYRSFESFNERFNSRLNFHPCFGRKAKFHFRWTSYQTSVQTFAQRLFWIFDLTKIDVSAWMESANTSLRELSFLSVSSVSVIDRSVDNV